MSGRGIRRRMALGLAVLTTAGLLTLAGPPASAEAAASCGGRKVRTLTFATGTVQVYRKGGRYVCAVLVPRKQARKGSRAHPGLGRPVGAQRQRRPAGPVTVHAGRRCRVDHTGGRVGSGWTRSHDSGLDPPADGSCATQGFPYPSHLRLNAVQLAPFFPGAPAVAPIASGAQLLHRGETHAQGTQMAAVARGAHRHVEHGGGGHRRRVGHR